MKKAVFFPFIVLFIFVVIFFKNFLLFNQLPIPSDTIIGLYHPFRDTFAKEYPNGIPFKNFLITDPVRQQYPWRELVTMLEKKAELPLWNPYNFAGAPLLANFQSAAFYPLNILFLVFPIKISWSIFILLQPLLASYFMYLYLRNINVSRSAGTIGALVFSFSGFSIAWLEWGTVMHTALWLPLLLLITDKSLAISNVKRKALAFFGYIGIFVFSLISAFFAGHLQTFFYLFVITCIYFLWRTGRRKNHKIFVSYFVGFLFFGLITSIQWIPTFQFILQSGRSIDQSNWQQPGWFLPWQHLIQFIAPDFFGNPTTLNYWGVWNYAEFIGYIGILPLLMAFYAIFFRHDKEALFFKLVLLFGLIFSLQSFLAAIPYMLSIPFISTSQPTRLLFVIDFSLSILCALGIDRYIKEKNMKKLMVPVVSFLTVFVVLGTFIVFGNKILPEISLEEIETAKRNLFLPAILFVGSALLLFLYLIIPRKFYVVFCVCMVLLTAFDLYRFGQKFTPFTSEAYLFPSTKTLSFMQKNVGNHRIMATDSRILPPNFSLIYRLQTVDGYDPLFILRYAELIVASERGKPDISPPFGFNRIITPHNFNSPIVNLLGVKYVVSLTDLQSEKLIKVYQEGQTRIYENKSVLPRVFLVENIKKVNSKQEAINKFFEKDINLSNTAIVEELPDSYYNLFFARKNTDKAVIAEYSENKVRIEVNAAQEGFLVLTDSFYPTWKAYVDGKLVSMYRTDYNFRGVFTPAGTHTIEFINNLF